MLNGNKLDGFSGLITINPGFEVVETKRDKKHRVGLYIYHDVAMHFAKTQERVLVKKTFVIFTVLSKKFVVPIDNLISVTRFGFKSYKSIKHTDYMGIAKISVGYELIGQNNELDSFRIAVYKKQSTAIKNQKKNNNSYYRSRLVIDIYVNSRKYTYVLDVDLVQNIAGQDVDSRFTPVGCISSDFIERLNKVA